ncbi:cystatin-like protein isoform X1 [Megalops cyprinoides]|uniref:cystatin-like protein isoform X1 n=1 Tax=Megalops cyprinoides TaxID=118141 RepID=UPI001863EEB0|nr:cystatin-like protein isoform X1 [Megalops cyprinoides]
MSRPLLILLLSTGALLITTEGQQSFHTLPQLYKKTINLAIQHANKGAQQHMNYHGVLTYKEDPTGYIYANFILRETTCDKTDVHEHRTECTVPAGKPFINCVVCCNRSGTELQKPFIDCIRHKEVSSRTEIREKTCSQLKPHLPGSGSIMTQKTASSETQTNCLGCF